MTALERARLASLSVPRSTQLRVLHALRLKSFIDTEAVAAMVGADAATTAAELEVLAAQELIRHKQGSLTGWMLLPLGRQRGEELLAAELDETGSRKGLESLYARFLDQNQPFLALCTDWQTRTIDGELVRNDHGDAEYDAAVITRLNGIDVAMQPVWSDLGELLDRFGQYGSRFAEALERLNHGDTDWFTSPLVDSYHTVWFELHEDLLASLGIERAKEVHT